MGRGKKLYTVSKLCLSRSKSRYLQKILPFSTTWMILHRTTNYNVLQTAFGINSKMKKDDVLIHIHLPPLGSEDDRLMSELKNESINPILDYASALFNVAKRMKPIVVTVFVSGDTHENDRNIPGHDIVFWRAQDDVEHSWKARHSCILRKNREGFEQETSSRYLLPQARIQRLFRATLQPWSSQ